MKFMTVSRSSAAEWEYVLLPTCSIRCRACEGLEDLQSLRITYPRSFSRSIYPGGQYEQLDGRLLISATLRYVVKVHGLALMHIHHSMDIDMDNIIDEFCNKNPRRMRISNILKDD